MAFLPFPRCLLNTQTHTHLYFSDGFSLSYCIIIRSCSQYFWILTMIGHWPVCWKLKGQQGTKHALWEITTCLEEPQQSSTTWQNVLIQVRKQRLLENQQEIDQFCLMGLKSVQKTSIRTRLRKMKWKEFVRCKEEKCIVGREKKHVQIHGALFW